MLVTDATKRWHAVAVESGGLGRRSGGGRREPALPLGAHIPRIPIGPPSSQSYRDRRQRHTYQPVCHPHTHTRPSWRNTHTRAHLFFGKFSLSLSLSFSLFSFSRASTQFSFSVLVSARYAKTNQRETKAVLPRRQSKWVATPSSNFYINSVLGSILNLVRYWFSFSVYIELI